jgi:hypothetical protein
MPAHLPEDNLHEFIEKTVGGGSAAQEFFSPFPMDEGACAKDSIDNPIVHVQEFMAVAHFL